MKLKLEKSGGFAYIPALARSVAIDTATCTEEVARHLESLVQGARFFDLPEHTAAAPGAADYQSYTLTVDDGHHSKAVTVVDPVNHPGLQALIEELERTVP